MVTAVLRPGLIVRLAAIRLRLFARLIVRLLVVVPVIRLVAVMLRVAGVLLRLRLRIKSGLAGATLIRSALSASARPNEASAAA